MKKGGIGGGNTVSGLHFEKKIDFLTLISQMKNYEVKGFDIYFCGKKIAQAYKKWELYKYFLEPQGVNYKQYIASQILPDNAIYVRGLYAGDLISKEYKQVGPIKILIKGTQK